MIGTVRSFQNVVTTRTHGVTSVKTAIFALDLRSLKRKRKRIKEERGKDPKAAR
jgi:hypothetical protein